jgi:hypothetical protein
MLDTVNIWLWVGIGCIVIAIALFLVRTIRRRPASSRHVSASHGGVAIGGNNNGIIATSKEPRQGSVLELVLSIAGVLIAILAWLFPKAL